MDHKGEVQDGGTVAQFDDVSAGGHALDDPGLAGFKDIVHPDIVV